MIDNEPDAIICVVTSLSLKSTLHMRFREQNSHQVRLTYIRLLQFVSRKGKYAILHRKENMQIMSDTHVNLILPSKKSKAYGSS
jgi:hypothetical protein